MIYWTNPRYCANVLRLAQQVRYNNEEDIRMKLADLNTVKGKINSVKFNIKKKELSNKLDIILR